MTLTIHGPQAVYHDTKANLVALVGLRPDTHGFATDTKESGWFDGSAWHWVPSGGSGDVVGPAGATGDHIAKFDGATGKLLKDGGAAPAGDVVGPAGATSDHLAKFDGATGKLLKDGGAAASGDVVGPAGATTGHMALFDGATGKLIKDGGAPGGGGNVFGNASVTDGHLAVFDADGYHIKDGGAEHAGDVVGPAGATSSRLAAFDGATGKLLKDPGALLVADVLMDTVVGVGGAANFDLNGIAAGYKKIEIYCTCRSSLTTSASLLVQFNADTTATNYQEAFHLSGTGTANTWTNDNRIGYLMPSDQTANRFAFNKITLFDYDASDKHKDAHCEANYHPNTTTGYLANLSLLWKNTAAITRITLVPGAGSFVQGSRCVILGFKTL